MDRGRAGSPKACAAALPYWLTHTSPRAHKHTASSAPSPPPPRPPPMTPTTPTLPAPRSSTYGWGASTGTNWPSSCWSWRAWFGTVRNREREKGHVCYICGCRAWLVGRLVGWEWPSHVTDIHTCIYTNNIIDRALIGAGDAAHQRPLVHGALPPG